MTKSCQFHKKPHFLARTQLAYRTPVADKATVAHQGLRSSRRALSVALIVQQHSPPSRVTANSEPHAAVTIPLLLVGPGRCSWWGYH